jgi:ElaB/YqjD/DUF883 family membrane-anchored ribosome-binding protein
MTADAALSRELKSLHEELSAAHPEYLSPSVDNASASGGTAAPTSLSEDTPEGEQLPGELRELVNAITEFFDEAEKNVSAHPTASVIGAMVAGILIGRLLGRR